MGLLSCCSASQVKNDSPLEESPKAQQCQAVGLGKALFEHRTYHASAQETDDGTELRITAELQGQKTASASGFEQTPVNASMHPSLLQSQLKALSGAGLSASQIHVNWCQPSELVADVHELRWVGQGSQGVVYEGTWQGASVAVKWSIAEELDTGAYELLFSRLLGHPNVVQTYDAKVAVLDHQIMTEDPAPTTPLARQSERSSGAQQEGSVELGRSDSYKSDEGFGNPYGRAASLRDVRCMLRLIGAQPGQCITQLIMEHCDQGSLLTAISRGIFIPTSRFGPKVALRALYRTAREVAQGMLHLHQSHVVHGDLKPANVLLMNSRKDRRGFVAKVSDFGLAQYCPASCVVENAPWGTLVFMAPERIQSRLLLPASDVWSFGVMLWQMYTAKLPYEGAKQAALLQGVMDGTLHLSWPPGSPQALMALTEDCMAPTPRHRPSFAELVDKLANLENDVRMEGFRLSHSIDIQGRASNSSEMTRKPSSRSLDLCTTADAATGGGNGAGISPRNSTAAAAQKALGLPMNPAQQFCNNKQSCSGPLGAQAARQAQAMGAGTTQNAVTQQSLASGQWMRATRAQSFQQMPNNTSPMKAAGGYHPANVPGASGKWRGIVAGVSMHPASSSSGHMPSTPSQMPTTPQHGNMLSTSVSAVATTCSSSSLDWQSVAGSQPVGSSRRSSALHCEGVAASPLGTPRTHVACSSLGGSASNSFVKRAALGAQRPGLPHVRTTSTLTVSSGPDTPGHVLTTVAQDALVKLDTGLPVSPRQDSLNIDGEGSWKSAASAAQPARHDTC